MSKRKLSRGLVEVYTGDGKGKTTAALGLALRAVGHGFKVYMIQFMKGHTQYGELNAAHRLSPYFKIVQYGRPDFVNRQKPEKIDIELARKGLEHARKIIQSNKYDIVILDEINVALDYKLVKLEDILSLIKNKPSNIELILTGRNAPSEIISAANLVTEFKEIKHPYMKGLGDRTGIEH
jgi:cob(I)alamin adenosyltransferase